MSRLRQGLQAILSEPANGKVLRRFFWFVCAVAFIPVTVYASVVAFIRTLVASGSLSGANPWSPSVVASLCAVLALNILTAIFAIGAVYEPVIEYDVPRISTEVEDIVGGSTAAGNAVVDAMRCRGRTSGSKTGE